MKLTLAASAVALAIGALTASHFTALRWSGNLEAVKVEYQQREHAAVLAQLFADADELAERMAAAADESRVRGLACERAYDSLRND